MTVQTATAAGDGWHPAVAAATDGILNIARWYPENGHDTVAFTDSLLLGYFGVKAAYLVRLVETMAEQLAFTGPTIYAMYRVAIAEHHVIEVAADAHATLQREHWQDIRRVRNPRPNEWMWNK